MASVEYDCVTKRYPDGTLALRNLQLSVSDGEFVVLVGPSGCGKTTALRMLAGLEDISAGEIRVGGRLVNGVDPSDRDIAMVFQNYALYPHMSVAGNMGFPLRMRGLSRAERDEKVRQVARILGLERYLGRKPSQLSGGQRQRVAMGRALVREPQVFLMDEPLSNLDAKLRVQMRSELAGIQRQLGVTTIYVTHDQVEAMILGSRVAVLRRGILQQESEPQALYQRPANMFVAGFIGSPPMNLLEGQLIPGGDGPLLRLGTQTITVDPAEFAAARNLADWRDKSIVVGVRPEQLVESGNSAAGARNGRTLRGPVAVREGLGSEVLVHMVLPGTKPLASDIMELAHDVEDPAELEGLPHGIGGANLVGRLSPDFPASQGQVIEVLVGAGALVFFDPQTGNRIAAE